LNSIGISQSKSPENDYFSGIFLKLIQKTIKSSKVVVKVHCHAAITAFDSVTAILISGPFNGDAELFNVLVFNAQAATKAHIGPAFSHTCTRVRRDHVAWHSNREIHASILLGGRTVVKVANTSASIINRFTSNP